MITIHVEYVRNEGHGDFRRLSVTDSGNSIDVSIDELAPEITERIALLRLAPEYDRVEGVGNNRGYDMYFLYFPDDFDLTRLRP